MVATVVQQGAGSSHGSATRVQGGYKENASMFCALAASFESGTRMLQGRCGEAAGRASVDLLIKGGQRPPITVAFDEKVVYHSVRWGGSAMAQYKHSIYKKHQH